MFSIVIPLYNKEKQIKRTLISVLNQTVQNFEIVIINDGSTDKSVDIVSEFEDKRIRLISQDNKGVSAARNKGIEEAKSQYIALLDADDEWDIDYLESQSRLIENYSECSVFACSYKLKTSEGEIKDIVLNKMPFGGNTGVLSNYFEVAACSHPPICSINIVARKEAFLSVGGFPEGVTSGEDLLTWAKLALKYPIVYNKESKVVFCLSDSEGYIDSPSRMPDKDDVVGGFLQEMYKENKNVVGLRQYVSLWYKMRASMQLLLGENKAMIHEAIKSLQYYPFNIKVWVYLGMLALPLSLRYRIFRKFGSI